MAEEYIDIDLGQVVGDNGKDGTDGQDGTDGRDGQDGRNGMDGIFDRVIRTQAEFDELIASPDWLGAVSVAFVGMFTKTGTGIKIPATVRQIQGFNGALIKITEFENTMGGNSKSALFYDARPSKIDSYGYSISDLAISCSGKNSGEGVWASSPSGFLNCPNVTNCAVFCTAGLLTGPISGHASGFQGCGCVTNCKAYALAGGEYGFGIGFIDCDSVVDCSGFVGNDNSGFPNYMFAACDNLVNCEGDVLSENGSVFYSCNHASNCRKSGTIGEQSATRIWDGTNTYRDDDSCQLD